MASFVITTFMLATPKPVNTRRDIVVTETMRNFISLYPNIMKMKAKIFNALCIQQNISLNDKVALRRMKRRLENRRNSRVYRKKNSLPAADADMEPPADADMEPPAAAMSPEDNLMRCLSETSQ